MDQSLMLILLGVIAVVLVAQTALLAWLGLTGQRLARRLSVLERDFGEELRPSLASARRVAENAERISESLVGGLPQLEQAIEDAAENVRRATRMMELLENLVVRPLRPLAAGWALWRGVRSGLEAYRRPGLPPPRPRG
jgi:hypothetical protein